MFTRHRSTVVVAAAPGAAIIARHPSDSCSRHTRLDDERLVAPDVTPPWRYGGERGAGPAAGAEQLPSTEEPAPVRHAAEGWVAGPSEAQADFDRPTWRSLRPTDRTDATGLASLGRVLGVGVAFSLVVGMALLGWHVTRQTSAVAAQPPVQSTPAPASDSTFQMGNVSVGVPAVDSALGAFLTANAGAAVSQLVVQHITCGTIPSRNGPVLPCLEDETPGAVHDVVLATCPSRWVPVEAARAEIAALLTDTPGVFAVTTAASTYTAVLSWNDAPNRSLVLTINALGVASYGSACGPPAVPSLGRAVAFAAVPGR